MIKENFFLNKNLFSRKNGYYPYFLFFSFFLPLVIKSRVLTNYDLGQRGQNVSLFMGHLQGIGDSKTILFILSTSLILLLISLLVPNWQRSISVTSGSLWLLGASIHLENQTGFDHTIILPTQLFLTFLIYLSFFRPSFYGFEKLTYPNWLIEVPVFLIFLHYFGSGVTKLIESGLSWADGTSLMTWVYIWGPNESIFSNLILNNYHLSKFFQIFMLTIECASIVLLFTFRFFRIVMAILLISFHVINEFIFNYGFWPNILILIVVLIIPQLLNTKLRQAPSL